MTLDAIFYTQIVTIISYISITFVLYRLLVAQKDATIEHLKCRKEDLEKQVAELKKQTPDALLEALHRRIEITKSEIENLKQDGERHQTEISHKESELKELRGNLNKLQGLLEDSDLVCPECGAPLNKRESHTVFAEFNGRDAEYDVLFTEYECGYCVSDDREDPLSPCRGMAYKARLDVNK
ncbi:coiled-coil domain-containing protein [Aeromonas veronii]|uniref:coiled-coil domain-containing protein n=1 Tax=Aeromonas TaxID=642 RepID=UPI00191E0AED|nr:MULTISPECIES: hypothetical protein [Aeromonas]MBL0568779.1 hypothetical protein [Aeromonas hydrophila]MCY9815735.1 hypothetical protein [Aeromonas caviae]